VILPSCLCVALSSLPVLRCRCRPMMLTYASPAAGGLHASKRRFFHHNKGGSPSHSKEQMAAQMFERKEYDVTNLCGKYMGLVCFFPCSVCNEEHLVLEPEEAVLTRKTMCDTNVQRRPYGELGSVDKGTACGCCVNVTSGLGPISPGWGCEEALVTELVEELKVRMKTRGDTGNIQRAEQQIDMINKLQGDMNALTAKVDLILQKLAVASPPPSPPPLMQR